MESLIPVTIQMLLIASALVLMGIMAWSDARYFRLPLASNIIFLFAGLVVGHLAFGISKSDALIGAGAGYLGLAAVAAAYRHLRGREGLGGGDPILLGGIGAWLGWLGLCRAAAIVPATADRLADPAHSAGHLSDLCCNPVRRDDANRRRVTSSRAFSRPCQPQPRSSTAIAQNPSVCE
jgi:hypothetical protein